MKKWAATSEFWVGIASIVGTFATNSGLIDHGTWDKILWPAGVYVVSRITSKVAKANVK